MSRGYGNVSLFGLDEFGSPVGLNPMWGVAAGGSISTGTAIAVREFTKQVKYAEGIGALAGIFLVIATNAALKVSSRLRDLESFFKSMLGEIRPGLIFLLAHNRFLLFYQCPL